MVDNGVTSDKKGKNLIGGHSKPSTIDIRWLALKKGIKMFSKPYNLSHQCFSPIARDETTWESKKVVERMFGCVEGEPVFV